MMCLNGPTIGSFKNIDKIAPAHHNKEKIAPEHQKNDSIIKQELYQ